MTSARPSSILTHLQNRAEVVRAARGDPGLQVLANFRPCRRIPLLGLNFQKMPPMANRALDGYLSTMFHKSVHSSQLTVHSEKQKPHRWSAVFCLLTPDF